MRLVSVFRIQQEGRGLGKKTEYTITLQRKKPWKPLLRGESSLNTPTFTETCTGHPRFAFFAESIALVTASTTTTLLFIPRSSHPYLRGAAEATAAHVRSPPLRATIPQPPLLCSASFA